MADLDIEAMRRGAESPTTASRADAEAVARDLSDAFADDPMVSWFMRTDAKRDAARLDFFRFLIGKLAFPLARIDRPAGGGAAAVWLPFEWLAPTPFLQELASLPVMLRTTGLARFGRMSAVRRDMDAHHPTDRPHAYLWFLGVTPAAQGHGVGSRLLKAASSRLDAAGQPSYLETATERNVALYRRHGFEVISEHKARPDAPVMWSMWREPQAPTA
jgi:ribosomal protein S18 acetylase RimI-like enzyme